MYQNTIIKSLLNYSNDNEILPIFRYLEQNAEIIFTSSLPLFKEIKDINSATGSLPNEDFLITHTSLKKDPELSKMMNMISSQSQTLEVPQIMQYAVLQKKIGLGDALKTLHNQTNQELLTQPIGEIEKILDNSLFNLSVIDKQYHNDTHSIFSNDEGGVESFITKQKAKKQAQEEGEIYQWDIGIKGMSNHNIYIRPSSSFIVYGAYVGNGKSTLVRKTIKEALKQKKNVYLCSTEMSEEELLSYILSDLSAEEVGLIPQREIEKLEFEGNNEEKYYKLLRIFSSDKYGRLIINYPTTSEYSVEDAVDDCIIHHKTVNRIDLFILDYLTNIKPLRGNYSTRDETTLYNNAIRDTKRRLLKHQIPCIATAQLNRKSQTEFLLKGAFPKNDAIYMYSEFDKSATQIVFVGTNDEDRAKGVFRLQIAKNRNGSLNDEDILLLMNRQTSSFRDHNPMTKNEETLDETYINEVFDIFNI